MHTRYPLIVVLSVLCLFLVIPHLAKADCSCSIGGNGIYVIGYEFIATTCPSDPPSDNHSYTYNVYPVNCVGGTITKYSSYGDISGSPNDLINFYTNAGYRLIRNPSGNHMIAVQNGNYPYQGVVSGLSMAGRPAGVYYTDPVEEANEICTPVSSPADQDGDGYTICFDCDETDPNLNIECAPCQAEYQAKIEECGGEDQILSFDYTTCTGTCIPPCQAEYQAKIEECGGEYLILSFDYTTCSGTCNNRNNGPMCGQ